MYLYRAVDKGGNTVDFLLTKRRNKRAAHLFLLKAIHNNGKPDIINIDKSGNVDKNGWWFCQEIALIFRCQSEEEAGAAGEQPASNRIDAYMVVT